MLSHEHIKDNEDSCIEDADRTAQDAAMLHHCLVKSLTKEAQNKTMLHKKDFTRKVHTQTIFSGLLFLKVTIRESHIDTNATTQTMRTNLSSLNEHLPKMGHDISKFNGCVMLNLNALNA